MFVCLITAEKGGVARAKGEGEKEKECTTECKSRRRRDEKAPGHLITGAGREEVMRKGGGEEARSVRCMCDVCAAHEELVAASKQFRRSRGEKSTRLGLVALTVGPVYIRIRASKERASEGSVCGRAIDVSCNFASFR